MYHLVFPITSPQKCTSHEGFITFNTELLQQDWLTAKICNVLLDLERDFARMEVSLHYLSLCDCFFKSKVMLG